MNTKKRIKEAVKKANDVFWDEIGKKFSEEEKAGLHFDVEIEFVQPGNLDFGYYREEPLVAWLITKED